MEIPHTLLPAKVYPLAKILLRFHFSPFHRTKRRFRLPLRLLWNSKWCWDGNNVAGRRRDWEYTLGERLRRTSKISQDIVTPSTSRQFPSSAYITHTISGYRSRLIQAGSLPWQPTIHHTFFFIKLIFFKKSRSLSRLSAATPEISSTVGRKGKSEKFIWLSRIRWIWKLLGWKWFTFEHVTLTI